MAGLGRRTHYRKHLTDSIIYDFPEPGENERIAKVVATRGSNQFDIVLSSSDDHQPSTEQRESHLAILPTKFNKLVWVKRNDFVIVETGVENDEPKNDADTGSIRYIISHILYKDQVKHLQTKGLWPSKDAEFATDKIGLEDTAGQDGQDNNNTNNTDEANPPKDDGIVYDTGYEDDDEYLVNTNRLAALKVDDSSDSESGDEE
ncbi:Probable RNA-binding protein EIF1AD [Seminavis robusta]|uniref:Probable RNA-binding protein EIF1AD n=1 Tax=Seminavis robusta TaxID=568900 RepID=A0A9N8ETT6_9STRA|nr:Probable RNA-binding protein EIF1AD [Seminavis robusta]|eukprot:Sro1553_g281980.1 Probable RNA-binding protein EIF1AD (204) ;mRNA; r:25293-25904